MAKHRQVTPVDSLIQTLVLKIALHEAEMPAVVDGASYSTGFKNGVRSALADVVVRLRELDLPDEAVIGL